MKTIYKSLMTIAFAGLCLASCDKELKEDTAMEVGVVTDSNVSFDGKTVTVKKGSPVTFSGHPGPGRLSRRAPDPVPAGDRRVEPAKLCASRCP